MRRQRLAVALVVLAAVGLGLAAPSPSLALSESTYPAFGTVGAGHTLPNGAWGFTDGCDVGIANGSEYRCAAEFDMSGIPSTARIMSAVVALKKTGGCPTNDCSVDLAVFAGNGNEDLGDVLAGSVAATFSPGSTVRQFNVTGHVQDQVTNGGDYFGIRLSRAAGSTNTAVQSFGIPDFQLTVSFVYRPVTVDVHLGGLGTGNVTSSPAGIDCGSTCTWWFEWLEPLTLTANPENGGTFSHWEGGECDGSTNPVCSFDVPATFVDTTAIFNSIGPPISQPPGPTPAPTPTQLTPAPSTATPGPGATGGPASTLVAPTDVIASDGTVITPAPTQAAAASGAAPTILGLDGQPADSDASGGISLPIVILLILILGGAVGAGVYWYTKRRQAAA